MRTAKLVGSLLTSWCLVIVLFFGITSANPSKPSGREPERPLLSRTFTTFSMLNDIAAKQMKKKSVMNTIGSDVEHVVVDAGKFVFGDANTTKAVEAVLKKHTDDSVEDDEQDEPRVGVVSSEACTRCIDKFVSEFCNVRDGQELLAAWAGLNKADNASDTNAHLDLVKDMCAIPCFKANLPIFVQDASLKCEDIDQREWFGAWKKNRQCDESFDVDIGKDKHGLYKHSAASRPKPGVSSFIATAQLMLFVILASHCSYA